MRIIKKYKNRRLYDTEIKKTVNLENLKSYLSDDIEFKVIDNASGRDITLGTLAQMISRPAADFKDYGFKAINVMIRKGGLGGMDIVRKLALASIGAVNLTREKAEEIFDEMSYIALGMGGAGSGEHGVGTLKRELFLKTRTKTELALLRGVKQVFDPKNILNPGTMI